MSHQRPSADAGKKDAPASPTSQRLHHPSSPPSSPTYIQGSASNVYGAQPQPASSSIASSNPLSGSTRSSISNSFRASNNSHTTASIYQRPCLSITDLPQFEALLAAAREFRHDDKLHLRNLCNDSARCAGLVATHTTVHNSGSNNTHNSPSPNQHNGSLPQHAHQHQNTYRCILDYSRQCVTGETMELLFDLADAVGLTDFRQEQASALLPGFSSGSLQRQHSLVLHHVLLRAQPPPPPSLNESPLPTRNNLPRRSSSSSRRSSYRTTSTSGTDPVQEALDEVYQEQERIRDFSEQVRSGEYRSVTGKPFRNVVVIGKGGSYLGPSCVATALESEPTARVQAQGRTLTFLANVDPVDVDIVLRGLDAQETLVVIVSKTFATPDETLLNTRTVRDWLVRQLHLLHQQRKEEGHATESWSKADIIRRHMVAITCKDHGGPMQVTSNSMDRCQRYGIDPANVFSMPDWVIGRFSVSSAVGLLPLSLQYSFSVMSDFLRGAHDMDDHFFHAPLRDNIPVILGMLGVWNSTFLGYGCRAILPYSQALSRFPAHIQQVDMESNGKRVQLDGTPLHHQSGEITFGGPGTTCQHSFFQLLHQGRVVPADFIGFMESQHPIDLPGEAVSNHDDLMSHFFAQPDALAYGKTLMDLVQEGTPEPLREHMVFTGNRPSSSILMTRLDAFALGQLIALYEHRTAVQGFVWGINSFDQFGSGLGEQLAKQVRAQLSASRKTGASVQGFNTSTSTLLEHYLLHEKQQQQQQQHQS